MSGRIDPISIGFYDPFNIYPKIQEEISQKVQLTNLHWRMSSNDALRSIPQLPLRFVEETPKGFDNNSHPDINFLHTESPLNSAIDLINTLYARVMFIQCENLDTYKSQVRPLIRIWKESNKNESNVSVGWCIIYYIPSDSVTKSHLKVFEKLKLDNLEETLEHCVMIKSKYTSTLEQTELWNLLVSKLKSCVLHSFSNKLELLRNALLSKIADPMLLICVKEGLARQFYNFHLLEDALTEYDSLLSLLNDHIKDFKSHDEKPTSLEDFLESKELISKDQPSTTVFNIKCFIFTKQLIILEVLSNTASSLSISSLHVSEFLKRLKFFILDITQLFENSSLINEWVYKTINEVLTLDICTKNSLENLEQNETVNLISERLGEMLTLQRAKLLKIGKQYGYEINGILTDISFSESKFELTYEILKQIISSREKFEEQFITLTETAIQHYSISGRPRTVDTLSIDIILLYYQNGQYAKAALVLSSCPEFYNTQGWKVIGSGLLQTFIDSLEHIDQNDDFFKDPKTIVQAKSYALLLSSIQNDISVPSELLNKALKFLESEHTDNVITFDLKKLFKIEVLPIVEPLGDDTYTIDVTFDTKIPNALKLNDVELVLSDENDHFVKFSSKESTIQSHTTISLTSTQIILGSFKLHKLSVKFGSLLLSQTFDTVTDVIVYPSPNDLYVKIDESTNLFLNDRSFSIFIHPTTPINDISIEFKQLNDILEIKAALKLIDGDEITNLEYNNGIFIPQLEAKDYEIIIPYVPGIKSTQLELFINVRFAVGTTRKSQGLISSIDTALSVAVSVQDIFKTDNIYSKFSVGTADKELPIRIIDVVLNENKDYQVSSSLKSRSLIAFGEQPGSYFFKIEKKCDVDPKVLLDQFLRLDVEYNNLFEEIHSFWRKLLWDLLKKECLEKYHRLLTDWLNLVFDYQEYELNSVIKIDNANSINYVALKAINDADRSKVKSLVSEFIQSPQSCIINSPLVGHHLLIDVSIPVAEVIHTVHLKYDNSKIYTILGEELMTQLNLRSIVTKIKKATNTKKKNVSFEPEESKIFEVEISNNQDNWLINGKTKFSFEIVNNSYETQENLSLIPLKVGKLGLPKIKITKVGVATKDESYTEVDYKNENETIYVVSERS